MNPSHSWPYFALPPFLLSTLVLEAEVSTEGGKSRAETELLVLD